MATPSTCFAGCLLHVMEESVAEKLNLGRSTVTLGLPRTKTVLIIRQVMHRVRRALEWERGVRETVGELTSASLGYAYFTAPRVSSVTVLPSVFPSQICPF